MTPGNKRQIHPVDVLLPGGEDYVREQADAERVAEFVELYEEVPEGGLSPLPEIEVVEDRTGDLHLASGMHRLLALLELGVEWTSAIVHATPVAASAVDHAHELAIEADAHAAKPLTRPEKRRAVDFLLGRYPAASSAEIARKAGVSVDLVITRRELLAAAANGGGDDSGRVSGAGRDGNSGGGDDGEEEEIDELDLPEALHRLCWDGNSPRDLDDAGAELAGLILGYTSNEATIARIAELLEATAGELLEGAELEPAMASG
jgi:hypothetical protein